MLESSVVDQTFRCVKQSVRLKSGSECIEKQAFVQFHQIFVFLLLLFCLSVLSTRCLVPRYGLGFNLLVFKPLLYKRFS